MNIVFFGLLLIINNNSYYLEKKFLFKTQKIQFLITFVKNIKNIKTVLFYSYFMFKFGRNYILSNNLQ